jgi:probable F420-dependent oxidoreductase
MTPRLFRFGVIAYQAQSRQDWRARARKIEQLGYSTLLVPDHLGTQLAPVPAMLAAAEATSSLRVGSYVFANDFRHPVMLAREVATLDMLTDGRFECGIGTGYLRAEYEQSGLDYDPPDTRVRRLEEALHIVKGLWAPGPLTFSGTYYTINALEGFPRPVQQPSIPLLVGGAGKRMLSLAAREATIVSLAARALPDGSSLDVTDMAPAALSRKIAWIRQAAGERFAQLELNMLIFAAMVTTDRSQAAQRLSERFKLTKEQVLAVPHCLIGTPSQIGEELLERREKYGISYFSVFEESAEALAPVIAQLAHQ